MIDIALKHWVYETCIDVLFDKIRNNFINPFLKLDVKVGDRFNVIYTRNSDGIISDEWHHVIVRNVEEDSFEIEVYYYIEYENGVVIHDGSIYHNNDCEIDDEDNWEITDIEYASIIGFEKE